MGEAPKGTRVGAEERAAPAPSVRCDLCGAPMVAVHCRLVCENCGFFRDCSDP